MALTRQQILLAALGILDEYGLADLSMRRLSTTLGVQAGALYHHFPDKQTLLAGLADLILAEVSEPLGTWRPAVEAWAGDIRRVLLSHRDSAELVSTSRGFQLSRHDVSRYPATLFAAAGLSPVEAVVAASTCLHFILGHVFEEQARREWERLGRTDESTGPESMNHLGDESFAVGIALLLDGVAARIEAPAGR